MTQLPNNILNRKWTHSHEEDSGAEMVFRPPEYKFPPSRGRTGFELKADGTAIAYGIAPTDAAKQDPAKWELDDQNRLRLHIPSSNETLQYKLVAADPDRLVVQRLPS